MGCERLSLHPAPKWYVPVRSVQHPSSNCINPALKLYVPICSVQPSRQIAAPMPWNYRFLYVPCNTLGKSLQSWPETIRSYTFHATLSINSRSHVLQLYVPIRSVQPSRYSVRALYVPTRSYYVPIRSAYLFEDFVVKLYVPIRSVQQYRRSATREKRKT